MAQKLTVCKSCGKEIATSAKACPNCGAKNAKPIFTKWWFWAIILVVVIAVASNNGADDTTTLDPGNDQSSTTNATSQNNTVDTDKKNDVFAGDCGISAVAEMGTDIIGQPIVTASIKNTTDKNILAVKFYAVPLNVYGEELKGIFAQNELYTDDTIAAGGSTKCSWQFLEKEVKSVKLYVYSVYFEDGSEWGDKEATKNTILKKGLEVEVSGTSGD